MENVKKNRLEERFLNTLFEKNVSVFQLIIMAIVTYLIDFNHPIYLFLIGIGIAFYIIAIFDKIKLFETIFLYFQNFFTKKIKINENVFYIGDTIWFKEPLIHPATNEKIINGKILSINKDYISLYLADKTDFEDGYCESWIKSFSCEELQKNCKI